MSLTNTAISCKSCKLGDLVAVPCSVQPSVALLLLSLPWENSLRAEPAVSCAFGWSQPALMAGEQEGLAFPAALVL